MRCAGRDARTQHAVPRLPDAGAGPFRGIRLARRHVDRLRAACAGRGVRPLRAAGGGAARVRSGEVGGRDLPCVARDRHVANERRAGGERRRAALDAARDVPAGPADGGAQSEGRRVPARAVPAVRGSGARQRTGAEPRACDHAARHRSRGRFSLRVRRDRRAPLVRDAVPAGAAGRSARWPACSGRSRRGSPCSRARRHP